MSDAKVCPGCGTANSADSRFCGRCGTPLAAQAAPAAFAQPAPAALVAMPAPVAPAPVAAPSAAPAQQQARPVTTLGQGPEPADSKLKTMMMRASPFDAPGEAPPTAAPSLAASAQSGAPMRTMLGISMGQPAAPAAPAFEDHEPTARANAPHILSGAVAPSPGAPSPGAPSAAVPTAAPVAAPAPGPSARQPQRTMLGIAGPLGLPPSPASAPVAAPLAPAPLASPAPAASSFGAPPASAFQQPAPVTAPAAAPSPAFQQAAPLAPQPAFQQASPPQPAPTAPQPAFQPPAPVAAPTPAAATASTSKKMGPSHRTMLGVAAPVLSGPSPSAAASPAPSFEQTAPAGSSGFVNDTGELSIAGMPSPRRRNTGCIVAVLSLAVLVAMGALAAFVYYRFWGRGPEVRASVTQSPSGEVLRLTVPDTAPGTTVRFAGQEQPVTNGVVDLPLAADALHVGDNQLSVELVSGGTATTVPITLTVEYRVRADLAGLEASPPAIHVTVEALVGSTVTLGGAPLALDAQGRGRLEVPLSSLTAGADGALTHTTSYVVTPPGGAAANGTLTTRIPVTPLELARPLDGAVTDRASLEVVGRTAPPSEGQNGVQITIETVTALVEPDGRFHAEVPLPAAGPDGQVTLHVVGRRAGSAPRSVTISVRRVPDVRRAAGEVVVDRSVGYAQLADQAEASRGRLVALEGQVYNADVQAGRGVLQMLVRGCTRADRCPMWVTYAPSTAIESGAVVRVIGVAGGTQQFRAESGETRTVPRIDATFVIPSGP